MADEENGEVANVSENPTNEEEPSNENEAEPADENVEDIKEDKTEEEPQEETGENIQIEETTEEKPAESAEEAQEEESAQIKDEEGNGQTDESALVAADEEQPGVPEQSEVVDSEKQTEDVQEKDESKENVEGDELKTEADQETEQQEGEATIDDKQEGDERVVDETGGESEVKVEGEATDEEKTEEAGDATLPEATETTADAPDESEDASKIDAAFQEGDKPETPVRIGENLDEQEGEGAPTMDHDELERIEMIESPRHEGEDEYEEEEEEEEETFIDREALIEKYKQAIQEKKTLMEQNGALQNKLAEYFRKKKADSDGGGRLESDKNFSEYEERYFKHLKTLEELRQQFTKLKEQYKEEYDELKEKCEEKEEKVNAERLFFIEHKRQVASKSINSRTGRPILPKDLDTALANEQKKELDVVNARLENIKLVNKLKKEELALKSKEELSEGLHLIDFEQLKIENQTYNEKIEERNEELLKLRKKITSTVQVLTHLKEKLQFVQQENHSQKMALAEVDAMLAQKRDVLSKTKKSRDTHRLDNMQLRQNCGLLGNEMLLNDMEECVDKVNERKNALRMMEKEHVELSLRKNGIQHKIEQSRSADPLVRQ